MKKSSFLRALKGITLCLSFIIFGFVNVGYADNDSIECAYDTLCSNECQCGVCYEENDGLLYSMPRAQLDQNRYPGLLSCPNTAKRFLWGGENYYNRYVGHCAVVGSRSTSSYKKVNNNCVKTITTTSCSSDNVNSTSEPGISTSTSNESAQLCGCASGQIIKDGSCFASCTPDGTYSMDSGTCENSCGTSVACSNCSGYTGDQGSCCKAMGADATDVGECCSGVLRGNNTCGSNLVDGCDIDGYVAGGDGTKGWIDRSRYSVGGVCTVCDPGYTPSDKATLTLADLTNTVPNRSDYYYYRSPNPILSNTECPICPAGSYEAQSQDGNNSHCKKCPPGQYQPEAGKTGCLECKVYKAAGTALSSTVDDYGNGATSCGSPCKNDGEDFISTTQSAGGYVCACPATMVLDVNSTKDAAGDDLTSGTGACVCDTGYVWDAGPGACVLECDNITTNDVCFLLSEVKKYTSFDKEAVSMPFALKNTKASNDTPNTLQCMEAGALKFTKISDRRFTFECRDMENLDDINEHNIVN